MFIFIKFEKSSCCFYYIKGPDLVTASFCDMIMVPFNAFSPMLLSAPANTLISDFPFLHQTRQLGEQATSPCNIHVSIIGSKFHKCFYKHDFI